MNTFWKRLAKWFMPIVILVFALLCSDRFYGYHLSDHYSVCIDSSFSNHERQLIVEGISVWNTNKVRFTQSGNCDSYITKATLSDSDYYGPRPLGLSQTWRNRMLLFTDRANGDDSMMRWIAAHEAGHWIGLSHVSPFDAPAIMNSEPRKEVTDDLKPYPRDLEQLCHLWSCNE